MLSTHPVFAGRHITLASILLSLAAAPGAAQQTESNGSRSDSRDIDSTSVVLDEVIVRARKRPENAQRVPIAVDTFDAVDFFERGLYQLDDVIRQTTSVTLELGSVPQDINLSVRGLNPTRGRPNMAVLLDGIDITSESMVTSGGTLLIDPMLFDIEQVEIVKGPQNALYGRSAFAGAINYRTREPDNRFTAAVETDVGNFGQALLRGRISGPLAGDALRGSIAAATWNHDGFYDSPVTGAALGQRSGTSVAATLAWDPSANWGVIGRLSYEDSESGVAPQAHPAPTIAFDMPADALGPVINPAVTSILGVGGTVPDADELVISNSDNPRTGTDYPGSTLEVLRGTLTVTGNIDSGIGPLLFTSLTHVADTSSFQYQDFNAFGRADELPAYGEIWMDDDTDMFSQEFRLESVGDGPLLWTVGAQYWEEDKSFLNGGVTCLTYAPPFIPADAGPACGPFVAAVGDTVPRNSDLWTRDTQHWSIYGLLSWQLTERWSAILEARAVNEELTVGGPDLDNSIIDPLGIFGGGPVLSPALAGQVFASEDDNFVAPKVTLQYTPGPQTMAYFSVAEGFKPAGLTTVNGGGGTFIPESSRFERERVVVYELGAKKDFVDNNLRVNAALFFQDFTDKQVTSQVPDDNGFLVARVLNADAEIYGAELDVAWYPTEHLRLQAGYTFLASEFTDFSQLTSSAGAIAYTGGCDVVTTNAGQTTCRIDFTGNELERVPRHSFVGIVGYGRQLTAGTDWFVELQSTYQSERYTNQSNQLRFDSFWLNDFRIGVNAGRWQVVAYADNVFDNDTIRNGFNTGGYIADFSLAGATFVLPDSAQFYLPPPRTVGVRASLSFGE